MTGSVVAIDPGDVHCGMAIGVDRVEAAWECAPWEAIQFVKDWLAGGGGEALVVEGFWLYPDKAMSQVGGQLKTVELIGVLRYLHAVGGEGVNWAEQQASIKVPTRSILSARKIKSVAKASKAGGHAADAELHWHYYNNKRRTK